MSFYYQDFKMSDIEAAKVDAWLNVQGAKAEDNSTSGGRYSFTFVPTGIGTVIKVKDDLLNEEIDATDYSNW
jgi:hypothetical protein